MAITSFINMKGGVGKTTLCVNIAYALHKLEKKVLLIDLDPQFNATQHFLTEEEYGEIKNDKAPTIFNIFVEGCDVNAPNLFNNTEEEELDIKDTILSVYEGLDIIPGDLELVGLELMDRGAEFILKKFIEDHSLDEKYEYILIDCPPTNSLWTRSALLASEYYLIPVKPDFLSTLGLNLFITLVKKVSSKYNHKLKSAGIIFTMVRRHTNHAQETIEEIISQNDIGDEVYEKNIKLATSIAEAPKEGKFLFDMDEHGRDIRNITREFQRRLRNE